MTERPQQARQVITTSDLRPDNVPIIVSIMSTGHTRLYIEIKFMLRKRQIAAFRRIYRKKQSPLSEKSLAFYD